jgi:hypothetical protein
MIIDKRKRPGKPPLFPQKRDGPIIKGKHDLPAFLSPLLARIECQGNKISITLFGVKCNFAAAVNLQQLF